MERTLSIAADDRPVGATILAAGMALLGWLALGRELALSLTQALHDGRGVAAALYGYFRFFTILTNVFVAGLMSATAWRLLARRPLPGAGFYAAALVYAAVMSATYEILLRRLWSPRGLQFATDLAMHDIVPALLLLFWLTYAPKAPLRWRDPLHWLEYPAVYFVATELAGLAGADYPYPFLDLDRLGWQPVLLIGGGFLATFYGLGLAVVALARRAAPPATAPSLRTEG